MLRTIHIPRAHTPDVRLDAAVMYYACPSYLCEFVFNRTLSKGRRKCLEDYSMKLLSQVADIPSDQLQLLVAGIRMSHFNVSSTHLRKKDIFPAATMAGGA